MEPSEDPLEQDLVRLKCNADNYTYENLHWYRLDPQAVPPELDCKSLHQYAESLGGKLSFQTASNNWVLELTIPSIQLQDEGNYVCEVQNRRSGKKHCHRKYIPVKGEAHSEIKSSFICTQYNICRPFLSLSQHWRLLDTVKTPSIRQ